MYSIGRALLYPFEKLGIHLEDATIGTLKSLMGEDAVSVTADSYINFKKNARDGDLLLAASKKFSASPTRLWTHQPWTHVGMVIHGDCFVGGDPKDIYEFGAHNPVEKVESAERGIGVPSSIGVFDLSVFLTNYGGMYWYPLHDVSDEKRAHIHSLVQSILIREKSANKTNFASYYDLLNIALYPNITSYFNLPQKDMWCSTVVASVLAATNVLYLNRHIGAYKPNDFVNGSAVWSTKCNLNPVFVYGITTPKLFNNLSL